MSEDEGGGPHLGPDGLARTPWASTHPLLTDYYDTEWGLPVTDERGLFERVSLEAFQSGLSWLTILRKRPALQEAFAGFDPAAVATFDDDDIARLLADARIVRNRAKVVATIGNARAVLALRADPALAEPLLLERVGQAPLRIDPGLPRLVWAHRPAATPRPQTAAEVPTRSPESAALAADLRAHGLTFVGPVTAFALMEAVGMIDTHLVGSHRRGCSGLWPPDFHPGPGAV